MSVLTDMALGKVKRLDDQIKTQREYIETTRGELAAAEEDIAAWQTDRDELCDFLRLRGIEPPEAQQDNQE